MSESLIIEGKGEGKPPLQGTVNISGSKNATLPLMAASLLTDAPVQLIDVPDLLDVRIMKKIIINLGARINYQEGNLYLDSSTVNSYSASYRLVTRMRASFLILGPLLARFGKARISMPGGCAIGQRPVDLHWKGLATMGTEFTLGNGYLEASCRQLIGNRIYLDYPSVGATENIMMAATQAQGTTVIENAALEPEIVDLANLLISMGAKVSGAGTPTVKIQGVDKLHGTSHKVIPDRIEAGTYMIAAAMAGKGVKINNILLDHLKPLTAKLGEAGVAVLETSPGEVKILPPESPQRIKAVNVKTMPYPGFPTDLQPQFSTLLTLAEGVSLITETVFENRFRHAEAISRLGADMKIEGNNLVVRGKPRLRGSRVKATDLRGAAALVLAGLAAEGKTEVQDIYHLDRGYEAVDLKLSGLGAKITRQRQTVLPEAPTGKNQNM